MKDTKFKQLIIDVYKEWKKPERTFQKEDFGITQTYRNFWGELFGAISRYSFSDISNIHDFANRLNPNMLLLHSRVTGQEVEIYEWQLKDYKIEGDNLTIQLTNKNIVFKL